MKIAIRSVVLSTLLVLGVGSANAQWAVFDVSNYVQALQQVEQLNSQLNEMTQQLNELRAQSEQAKQSYQAMTGSRGMGNLAKDSVQEYLSQDLQQANSNSGQIAQLANQIKQKAGYLSTQDLSGINAAVRSSMERDGTTAANNQAMAQSVFSHSSDQFSAISDLMGQIDQAKDPKAIADLQARIQVQQASLQAQMIQAQAMTAMLKAQEQVQEEQQRQQVLHESRNYYQDAN